MDAALFGKNGEGRNSDFNFDQRFWKIQPTSGNIKNLKRSLHVGSLGVKRIVVLFG